MPSVLMTGYPSTLEALTPLAAAESVTGSTVTVICGLGTIAMSSSAVGAYFHHPCRRVRHRCPLPMAHRPELSVRDLERLHPSAPDRDCSARSADRSDPRKDPAVGSVPDRFLLVGRLPVELAPRAFDPPRPRCRRHRLRLRLRLRLRGDQQLEQFLAGDVRRLRGLTLLGHQYWLRRYRRSEINSGRPLRSRGDPD